MKIFDRAMAKWNNSFAGSRADLLKLAGINDKDELVDYANKRFENRFNYESKLYGKLF